MDRNEQTAIVRRYYDEIWSQGDVALVDELFTEAYVNEDPMNPGGRLEGREALKQLVGTFRTAFPDLVMRIGEQFVDGDVVVSRWVASGTHRGELLGIPPTGRQGGGVEGVTITRFEGGKIARDSAVWDAFGLLRQLGAIPAPAAATV